MISFIKKMERRRRFVGVHVNVLCLCYFILDSSGYCNDFALILLNSVWVLSSGYRRVVFSLCCSCFCIFSWITCYLSCLINRDIWRGIFAALAVVPAGYVNSGCFLPSIYWCFVTMLHSAGQLVFCTGRILLSEYLFLSFLCFSFSFVFVDLYYFSFVSAVPVGALDRVAGLLSRIWWQR